MSLEITALGSTPIHRMRALNARSGGGRESIAVPFLRGRVTGLPDALDALVIASDLQCVAPNEDGELVLGGVAVARELLELEGELPFMSKTGVILAGDLYCSPDATKRGGFGDVSSVWRAFHEISRWVTGVAGNHDDVSRVPRTAHLLDVSSVELDTLQIGGVGLICGDPSKPGRRTFDDQLAAIELMSARDLDVLVLHEGPAGDSAHGQPGNPEIQRARALTICGHVHWDVPYSPGARVLNVDGRVVILTR